MSNIAISDSSNYAVQQAQINNLVKLSEDQSLHPKAADNVQSFVALAIQPGMMAAILQGQSVMVNLDMRPALLAPPIGREKIDSEQKAELMNLVSTMKGADINKLERAAASAASIFSAQNGQLQTTRNVNNENKISPVATASTVPAADAMQTRTPVAGGTDITAPDAAGRQFVNMMGDLRMLEVNNLIALLSIDQETESNKAAAQSSLRAVNAAERAGNKGIDAEKQRMTGAITSGTIGVVGQGITTAKSVKAMKAESKSIKNNLVSAAKVDGGKGTYKSSVAASTDNMLHKGKPLGEVMSETALLYKPSLDRFGNIKRTDHNMQQLNTSQTRVTSDYSNAAINSSQKVIEGAFNVEAATDNKQVELARADQTVNNDIANIHQQTAKKAAESKAALNQALETMLNSKNNTLSSIADRMR